ncbi:MAG: hypothetical protein A2W07_08895 [candidate division Zixibacteria bacterium RBG_16_43_9]|nr:MAG: hypothetical protein A2W07_08895 [candidate division Zixibacteria bacterium RBG_16_43_9]
MQKGIDTVNALQRQSSLSPCGRGLGRGEKIHPPFVPPFKGGKLRVALPLLWQRVIVLTGVRTLRKRL